MKWQGIKKEKERSETKHGKEAISLEHPAQFQASWLQAQTDRCRKPE